jgi:hypothetical protein
MKITNYQTSRYNLAIQQAAESSRSSLARAKGQIGSFGSQVKRHS